MGDTEEFVSKEVLEKVKKALKTETEDWSGDGVCNGNCYALDGELIGLGHTACHSWVTHTFHRLCGHYWSPQYKKDAKPFLTASCFSTDGIYCSEEAAQFLVLWIARESLFSEYVLNRDDTDSLLKGGLILACGPGGLTPAEAMWVLKVFRLITEGGKGPDTFMELVKGGVDPMLALFTASNIRAVSSDLYNYTGPEGHSSVFTRGVSLKNLVMKVHDKGSTETSALFYEDERRVDGEPLSRTVVKGFCKPFIRDDGWGGKIAGSGVSGEDLIRQCLEWQKTLIPDKPDLSGKFIDVDL